MSIQLIGSIYGSLFKLVHGTLTEELTEEQKEAARKEWKAFFIGLFFMFWILLSVILIFIGVTLQQGEKVESVDYSKVDTVKYLGN